MVGDIGPRAQENQGKVFDRVGAGVNTAQETKALAAVDILAQCLEPWAHSWEGESLRADQVAVETKAYQTVSVGAWPRDGNSSDRLLLKCSRAAWISDTSESLSMST